MPARLIVNGDAEYQLVRDDELVVGRSAESGRCDIGLDDNDVGISRISIAFRDTADGIVITNISTKKPIFIDRTNTGRLYTLQPGDRYLATNTVGIEVRGMIRTHRLDAVPTVAGVGTPAQAAFDSRATVVDEVQCTNAELDALTALFQGYLEAFPRRDCQPNSYDEAGRLLDLPASTVRRRIERVRDRLQKIDVYIEGAGARDELATYVLDSGLIGPDDLSRLHTTD